MGYEVSTFYILSPKIMFKYHFSNITEIFPSLLLAQMMSKNISDAKHRFLNEIEINKNYKFSWSGNN